MPPPDSHKKLSPTQKELLQRWIAEGAIDPRDGAIRVLASGGMMANGRVSGIAVAPDGGEVWALAIDPQEALLDYLATFYNLRRAGSALRRIGAVDFATTLAPGLRDVLLTGKAVEVVRRGDKHASDRYDAVVMDAPPTGRIARFLNVNSEVAGIARVGPIHGQANSVMGVIRSPETAV